MKQKLKEINKISHIRNIFLKINQNIKILIFNQGGECVCVCVCVCVVILAMLMYANLSKFF